MASILNVDTINENTTGNGVNIPGHVVQVVQGTLNQSQISTTSSSDTASGVTASITPSSSSNKVLVIAYLGGPYHGSNLESGGFNIYRGGVSSGTKIGSTASSYGMARVYDTAITNSITMQYLDSPATTSSVTYEVSLKTVTGTGATYISVTQEPAYIILMEIAQ